MANYLIKLYPLDRFFFGGESTFGSKNENYLVRSEYFPQQTTLLGMLRYYMLQQNNMLNEAGKVVRGDEYGLIGEKGFDAEKPGDFGIIKKLSPVFISGPDGHYLTQSREYGLNWMEDEISGEKQLLLQRWALKSVKGSSNFSHQHVHYFDPFDGKTLVPNLLVNTQTRRMRYYEYKAELRNNSMNGVFIPDQQVGIRKNAANNADREKAYYKQIAYRLKPGYAFAFYAEIEPSASKNQKIEKEGLVKMGTDQSWFRIIIELQNQSREQAFDFLTCKLYNDDNSLSCKIVLLSDSSISPHIYNSKDIVMASASTVPFRYLETNRPNAKYDYQMERAGIKLKKTLKTMNLLEKGSVLYLQDASQKESIVKEIEKNEAFYQIGYNHVI